MRRWRESSEQRPKAAGTVARVQARPAPAGGSAASPQEVAAAGRGQSEEGGSPVAFHGKVALVTGAGSGMGQISAWRLADVGAQVAAVDINEEGLARTAAGRDNVHVFPCDVTDPSQVEQVVARVREQLGPIDRVTHAAAIMPASPLVDMPAEQILKIMQVNYAGTVYVTKATLPA
ncbi:MAG: SDR family NAD(P)-dependent oxidoreductase, partial [Candidatus Dadabacteria bacterium]